jgi:hypothetical protein
VAGNIRPHVQFRGLLHVRVTKFENDFGFICREAIFVGNALSQDERMIVEPEVGGVQEAWCAKASTFGRTVKKSNTPISAGSRAASALQPRSCARIT